MDGFLASIGTLSVEVGSGWISRYDSGSLRPGDVVVADEEAGRAQRVRLNGEYLCDASLAILNDRFIAKVERFEPGAPPPAQPERGDEVAELLPFAIRIASIEVELGQLSGIGRRSFIDLDKACRADEDAELLVAGIALAVGKVVVVGERFGLRILRRFAPPFEEPEMRTTGAVVNDYRCAEPVKDYNFRMPDCFTKRGILKAQDIHLEFLRTLARRLPAASELRLKFVDQLSYGEWADAQGSSVRSYALLPTVPEREREEAWPALPAKILLRPARAEGEPRSDELETLRAYAERSLRPGGRRPVVAAFDPKMRSLFEEDPDLATTAACLRNGWKRAAELRVAPAARAPASLFSEELPGDEAAYRGEMILYARIEDPRYGLFELVYPLRSLEACFAALNA